MTKRRLPPSQRPERSKVLGHTFAMTAPGISAEPFQLVATVRQLCSQIVPNAEVLLAGAFVCDSDLVNFFMPEPGTMDKDQADQAFRAVAARWEYRAVAVWYEAWMQIRDKEPSAEEIRSGRSLEGQPGTTEAVLLLFETPASRQVFTAQIHTTDGRRVLGAWEPFQDYKAVRFGNFFPQNGGPQQ